MKADYCIGWKYGALVKKDHTDGGISALNEYYKQLGKLQSYNKN